MAGTSSNVCKYFASSSGQGCQFGAMCNFSHDLSAGQGVVPMVPEQPPGPHGNAEGQHRRPQRPCRYFRGGFCKDGSRCKFSHDLPAAAPVPIQIRQQSQKQRQRQSLCKFFNSTNGCRHGDNCRFLHESAKGTKEPSKEPSGKTAGPTQRDSPSVSNTNSRPGEAKTTTASKTNTRIPSQRNRSFLESDLGEMNESEQQKARDTEVEVLKKRYPHVKELAPKKGTTGYQIAFKPTDPDWPYDVRSLDLDVYFPSTYPVKMMNVTLPEQENLPETVRICVEFSIADWISARHRNLEKKGRVERMFRPFLRWLDRDLQDIFTDALKHYQKELIAKASGIEVIPARHLQARYQQKKDGSESDPDESEPDNAPVNALTENSKTKETTQLEEEVEECQPKLSESQAGNSQFNPTAKGTEVKIKELQLGEGVGTLVATSIKLMTRCSRCKESGELVAPNNRLNEMSCSKCNQTQLIKYRAALTHGFSSVLGYLDLEECSPFDILLMDCDFVANCLSCNKDSSIGGIPPGQLKTSWCKSCHSKLTVAMEGVQFRQLQPTAIEKTESVHKVKVANAIRKVKDPAIKEGLPLPDQGTCKHYKKSYRWLRFPCCGKVYPCDICHEDKEDHEMKFANRMICGFCAHEQMYSGDKPCSACASSMTHKSTEHWEGGKGCRDVIRMSRNDDKKYANCNKTVSRKSQTKEHSGKKNLKLRHT